jgi:hypothetical protein
MNADIAGNGMLFHIVLSIQSTRKTGQRGKKTHIYGKNPIIF